MIRNIPTEYTQDELIMEVSEALWSCVELLCWKWFGVFEGHGITSLL